MRAILSADHINVDRPLMRKLVSLAFVAAGILVSEQVVLGLYRIWWVREYPGIGDPVLGRPAPRWIVRDALFRELTAAPNTWGRLFGRGRLWAGWGAFLINAWELVAASLAAYLLIRSGAVLYRKAILSEAS